MEKELTGPTESKEDKPKMSIEHPDFLKPYSLEGETDYQYKARKKIQELYIKQRKKGTLAWIAKDLRLPVYGEKGTTEENKVISYKISDGFTYNKEKFDRAIKEWQKKQEELKLINKLKEENK